MDRKLLTVCPTKNRPGKCRAMLESFEATKDFSEIIFVLDSNERDRDEYIDLFSIGGYPRCFYQFIAPSNITTQMNTLLNIPELRNYEYYHITNDDVIYRTLGWDRILTNKIEDKGGTGISFGDDLIHRGLIPTHPVISSDIVMVLGWLQMPKLTHLYGDSVWKIIGHRINKLYYVPEVVIEHLHPQKDKKYEDDIHRATNDREMYFADEKAVKEWIQNDYHDDVAKIEEMIKRRKL